MSTGGLSELSSENLGVAARSSSSGLLYVVFPKIGGLAVYSPKLDKGVSSKGVDFVKHLLEKFTALKAK